MTKRWRSRTLEGRKWETGESPSVSKCFSAAINCWSSTQAWKLEKEQVLQFVEGRKNPGDVYCQRHLLTSIFTPGGHIESMIRHKSCKSMFHDPRMNTTWNHDKTEFSFIFKVSFSAYLFFLFITLTKTFSSRVLALQQIIVCFKTPGKFVYVKKLHLMCVRKKDTR